MVIQFRHSQIVNAHVILIYLILYNANSLLEFMTHANLNVADVGNAALMDLYQLGLGAFVTVIIYQLTTVTLLEN